MISKTKPKHFKLRQGFLKTKQNFYLFKKKSGKEPECLTANAPVATVKGLIQASVSTVES